jgi:hypothetical protein
MGIAMAMAPARGRAATADAAALVLALARALPSGKGIQAAPWRKAGGMKMNRR